MTISAARRLKASLLRSGRAILRRILLRGRLLEWWTLRQNRRLDRAYAAELIRSGLRAAEPIPTPVFSKSGALRHLVLLADCMWERGELVPELERIAPVSVLDLRGPLRHKPPGEFDSRVVLRAVEAFLKEQSNLDPAVVLFYARSSLLSDEVFHVLKKRWSCPLFGMSLDDKTEFFNYGIFSSGDDNYRHWARYFDLNLSSSLTAVGWYHQHGLPCYYMPMGYHLSDTSRARPESVQFEHSLSFVGSKKPERAAMVRMLQRAGVPIALFGSGWPEGRWIDTPSSVYRRSQLNLGMGFATATGGVANLKARDFECPGAGGCYLALYNWELSLHFHVGQEILCYRSPEELLEMYHYYSKRPEQCLGIAQAGHRRCLAEHTWENRFRKLFQETGFRI